MGAKNRNEQQISSKKKLRKKEIKQENESC